MAVVEADFRRPVQSRLLRLNGSHGLADVLTGMLPLEDALQAVSLARVEASVGAVPLSVPAVAGSHGQHRHGRLPTGSVSVLVGGTKVANPPALLGNPATGELVRSLAADFDHVLLDVPSPLQVSDAIPLLAAVEGS